MSLPASARNFRRGWNWLGGGLIALAALWVYWPALRGDWVWDDQIDIVQNPVLRDPAGWWKIWLQPAGWHFFPLKSELQWWQWRWFGENTPGYHLTNVGLHAVSAWLLWRVLRRLGLRHAWLGGLWFAVHPLAVESVAWIAELKNALSLPLLLLAYDAWIDFDASSRGRDYARAFGFFLLAMLAKSSVVMCPLVLLLHAFWKRGRITGRDGRVSIPFFVSAAVLGAITVWVEHHQDLASLGMPELGYVSRLAGAGRAIAFYFLKFIFPAGLSPVYPEWTLSGFSIARFFPWAVLAAVVAVCWRHRGTWGRHALLGLGFYVVNLAPVLGFVPMAYHHIAWVADHFAYVSLVGLVGLAVAGVDVLSARLGRPGIALVLSLCLSMAVVWAAQGRRYAAAFRDEESLWRHAIAQYPEVWLPHHNLGVLFARTQRMEEAITHYEAALRARPDDFEALNDLGNARLAQGRLSDALGLYSRAASCQPDSAAVHANLGNVLLLSRRTAEGVAECERAVSLDPDNIRARTLLADAALQADNPPAAIAHYEVVLRITPNDAVAHNNLAAALVRVRRAGDALRHYEQALALAPGYTAARLNLGRFLADANRADEAEAQWREAVRREPGSTEARLALADHLVRTERAAEAAGLYEQVLRDRPNDADAHNNFAYALAQLGRIDAAIRESAAALRLRPDDEGMRQNLARLRAIK